MLGDAKPETRTDAKNEACRNNKCFSLEFIVCMTFVVKKIKENVSEARGAMQTLYEIREYS